MTDYNKKIEDAIEDYGLATARYRIVYTILESKLFDSKDEDSDIKKFQNKKGKESLMIDLGSIAEHSLKYYLKLKRIELFPDEEYDNGTKNSFKEKMRITKGTINEFISKVHGTDADKIAIEAARSVDNTGHNFDVVYTIIDRLFPTIKTKINEIIKLESLAQYGTYLIKELSLAKNGLENLEDLPPDQKEYIETKVHLISCFPRLCFKLIEGASYFKIGIDSFISERKTKREETIKNSGDVFTKLRYFSNHPDGYSYKLEELLSLANDLLLTDSVMRIYGNDLEANSDVAYAYFVLTNHPEYTNFSKVDLDYLFKHKKLKNNPEALCYCIFLNNNLSIEDIKKIINDKSITSEDCNKIFLYNLDFKTINYFRNIGIYDYDTMISELTIGNSAEEKLIGSLLNSYYSIEEYDNYRKMVGLENSELINHRLIFSNNAYEKVKQYPEILKYFSKKRENDSRDYFFNEKFVDELLKIDELKEIPQAWGGLDLNQLISSKYIQYSLERLLNENYALTNKYNSNIIINNIKENIELFKDSPELLENIPLMLDPVNNKKIMRILRDENLSNDEIRKVDSTIFCIPSIFLESIKLTGINIIENGDINSVIIDKLRANFEEYDYDEILTRNISHNMNYFNKVDYFDFAKRYFSKKADLIKIEKIGINNAFSTGTKKNGRKI